MIQVRRLQNLLTSIVRDYLNCESSWNLLEGGVIHFQVIDLKTQLKYYNKVVIWLRHKLGNFEAKMRLSRAVYLFSIGSNDYMSPFLTNSTILDSYSESEYVGMVIGNLTTVIKVSITPIFSFFNKHFRINHWELNLGIWD